MEQSTLFAEEAHARHSASQDSGRRWTTHVASSCSNISELAMRLIRNGLSGKTSPAYYPQMADALFGSLLAGVAELWPDGGAAWRVLDAQFFGVAQRRRRVFLVVNTRDWRRAAPVLFECERLRWDYPSSRKKREALAGGLAGGAGTPARSIDFNPSDGRFRFPEDPSLAPTLTARMGTGGNNVPPIYCATDSGTNMAVCRDMTPTLTAHDANSACFVNAPSTCIIRSGKECGGKGAFSVRRLTPVECERLQGFPDGWTDVPWRGAEHAPDSKRYKALGNSMAVPVMRWIGEGIQLVEDNKGLFQENPSEQ